MAPLPASRFTRLAESVSPALCVMPSSAVISAILPADTSPNVTFPLTFTAKSPPALPETVSALVLMACPALPTFPVAVM